MPTISVFNFVKFNFPVRSISGAHVNCEVGGGNNTNGVSAPPQPLSEVINIRPDGAYQNILVLSVVEDYMDHVDSYNR